MYHLLSFISLSVFGLVHLLANQTKNWPFLVHSRFLSMGGGIAIAYVFVDLLPKLSIGDSIVSKALSGVFPYFEKHVYVMALLGFLLFFVVDRLEKPLKGGATFWLSLSSYTLFNFLIGYAIVDPHNPEVRPLILFTLALSLHYFTNDYTLSETYGEAYRSFGKWVLILALLLGWITGYFLILSETAVALVSAFIGGGVIMNVIRHELPEEKPNSLSTFLIFTFLYTTILLFLGD
jgi:hypothetical protein